MRVTFLKHTLKVLLSLVLVIFVFHLSARNASATDCSPNNDPYCINYCSNLASQYPGYVAASHYCDDQGGCHCTWSGSCGCGWGDWGSCNYDTNFGDYLYTRYCSCNSILYQIAQCTPSGGPTPTPGGGATPTPSPAPAPSTCTSMGPSDNPTIPADQATYDVYVYGVQNTGFVQFNIATGNTSWSDWGTNLGGGTWKYTINFANSLPYTGQFTFTVYLNNSTTGSTDGGSWYSVGCGTGQFIRGSITTPTPAPSAPSCSFDPNTFNLNLADVPSIPYSQRAYDVYSYGVANAASVYFIVFSATDFQSGVTGINGIYPGVNLMNGNWEATINPARDSSTGFFIIFSLAFSTDPDLQGLLNIPPEDLLSMLGSALSQSGGSVTFCGIDVFLRLPPGAFMGGAWWQVKDGDVTTNGDLDSNVPPSNYFGLAGSGGYPGIPAYGSTNLDQSNVSTTGWLANSAYPSTKVYDSNYFLNSIPPDVSTENGTLSQITNPSIDQNDFSSSNLPTALNGYYWYEYDGSSMGDLTISSDLNLEDNKVILIVKNANLNINGNINLTKGSGFFLAVTSGNIIIAPNSSGVLPTSLEGIFVADGDFNTGTSGSQNDSQLWIRGTVAAYGGMNLQRDLGADTNLTTPAEVFEFAPDLELLYPSKLAAHNMSWQEVAP